MPCQLDSRLCRGMAVSELTTHVLGRVSSLLIRQKDNGGVTVASGQERTQQLCRQPSFSNMKTPCLRCCFFVLRSVFRRRLPRPSTAWTSAWTSIMRGAQDCSWAWRGRGDAHWQHSWWQDQSSPWPRDYPCLFSLPTTREGGLERT